MKALNEKVPVNLRFRHISSQLFSVAQGYLRWRRASLHERLLSFCCTALANWSPRTKWLPTNSSRLRTRSCSVPCWTLDPLRRSQGRKTAESCSRFKRDELLERACRCVELQFFPTKLDSANSLMLLDTLKRELDQIGNVIQVWRLTVSLAVYSH